jgi:hypothetical protein
MKRAATLAGAALFLVSSVGFAVMGEANDVGRALWSRRPAL